MQMQNFEKHVWAEIDLDALRANFRTVKQRAGSLPLCAVVKAARYAHARADSGGGAGGDAVRGHLPVGLHAAQDFARNAASREAVDSDELVRERAQAVGGHGRECGLGVLKRLVARLDEADL